MSQSDVESLVRPTTKDLAKVAGVSRATVDRVLNGRAKVKQRTVDRVNAAIDELGFVRNLAAANLAKGKSYRFLFVLPDKGDQFLKGLLLRIKETVAAFSSEMIWADVHHIDESDPHKIAAYLATLSPNDLDGIAIMAPESPQLRDAANRLERNGIPVLPFVSNQSFDHGEDWVGIDNVAAGATAATLLGRFNNNPNGAVLAISETMKSRDSLERRLGFDEIFNSNFKHVKPLPSLETYGSPERAAKIVAQTVSANPDIMGVYVMSAEARIPLEVLANLEFKTRPVIVAHERTHYTVEALKNGSVDAVITQDSGHLVRSAIRKLRARVDERETLASQERIRIEILMKHNL